MNLLLLFALLGAPVSADDAAVAETTEEMGATLPDPPLEDPPDAATADARTARLTKALRCPVCQGLSVSDSPSDAARAMGDRIEELVHLGYTEEQITEYFVDRYGPWVELEPPNEGYHRALFIAPLVLVGLGGILLFIWSSRRSVASTDATATPSLDPALAPYRARILEELDGGST